MRFVVIACLMLCAAIAHAQPPFAYQPILPASSQQVSTPNHDAVSAYSTSNQTYVLPTSRAQTPVSNTQPTGYPPVSASSTFVNGQAAPANAMNRASANHVLPAYSSVGPVPVGPVLANPVPANPVSSNLAPVSFSDPGSVADEVLVSPMEPVWDTPHRSTAMVPCQQGSSPLEYCYNVMARGYYMNDQRIEWSGQEATFATEGVVEGAVVHSCGEWQTSVVGQFFLNQPYDRNMLVAPAERTSYLGNFQIDIFEISQLYVTLERGDFAMSVGKLETPFGRYYAPLYTNSLNDAPFIRTEAINWRETGVVLEYNPQVLRCMVGVLNGSEDADTNSSKAIIARLGYENECFAMGASLKYQDGIGSEEQKTTNNHIGFDCMYRWGRWILSGEAIYDEYGFRKAFDPLDITWGRSIYYRDQFVPGQTPLSGVGYYGSLAYAGDCWTCVMSYGDYFPKQVGDPLHDAANHRGVLKAIRSMSEHLDIYSLVIMENGLQNAQSGRDRQGWAVWCGLQYTL